MTPVSYTHLDVYKRQEHKQAIVTNTANKDFADHYFQHKHFIDKKKHNSTPQHTKR